MAIIGIDLGTSNSAGAALRGGRPVIIPSAEGATLGGKAFPSYVAVTADGEMLVGELARRQATANPQGTTTGFKRRMGTREKIHLRDRNFSPEELSAFLLRKIKNDAEAFLGDQIERAVVTVPAYFDDNQRSATKDACRIAGIEVARLVNEPTAASLAYGLDRLGDDILVVVVDLGGGTLDVTILELGKGVFTVKSTSGDTHLGGTDMDRKMFALLADRFREESGVNVRGDEKASARLLEAAEVAKIELSSAVTTRVSLPFFAASAGQPVHLDMELTRAEIERALQPVVDRCEEPVRQALKDADVAPGDVDRLVFVGGPTRMPMVRDFFEKLLGRRAESGVDPMEVVASGAAIQGGVLSGEVEDIVLVDVTPLTLGVETLGGVATKLIDRNTPVPVEHTETFTTAADMQTSVTIHIYQGERPMASDNTSLGQFNLDGLAPAPRGVPQIDVTFSIDANGILNVSATDKASGKSRSIRITGSTRLSRDEKERMVQDAERYAEEDRKKRERAEKLNAADSMVYQAEKTLAEFGEKMPADKREKIEGARREVKEALDKHDPDLAEKRSEALKEALTEAGKDLYARAAEESAGPSGTVGGARGGGVANEGERMEKGNEKDKEKKVVDAEYTETAR